jgi:hypothetical protein
MLSMVAEGLRWFFALSSTDKSLWRHIWRDHGRRISVTNTVPRFMCAVTIFPVIGGSVIATVVTNTDTISVDPLLLPSTATSIEFRLLRRCEWDFRSSEMLRSVDRWLVMVFSTLEYGTDRLHRNVGKYQCAMRNVVEERRTQPQPRWPTLFFRRKGATLRGIKHTVIAVMGSWPG